jgi:hypothetical protein
MDDAMHATFDASDMIKTDEYDIVVGSRYARAPG